MDNELSKALAASKFLLYQAFKKALQEGVIVDIKGHTLPVIIVKNTIEFLAEKVKHREDDIIRELMNVPPLALIPEDLMNALGDDLKSLGLSSGVMTYDVYNLLQDTIRFNDDHVLDQGRCVLYPYPYIEKLKEKAAPHHLEVIFCDGRFTSRMVQNPILPTISREACRL